MNKLHITTLLLTLLSFLCCSEAWGEDGPEMNKAYTIDAPFSGSNSHNISKDYFLSGATSAVVQLTNVGWATMRIGQWGQDNVIANGVTNSIFSYELTGDELTAALAGNIYLHCEPAANSKLTIINKDANYVEPTPGESGGGESGGEGGGESGGGGSTDTNPDIPSGFYDLGTGYLFNQTDHAYSFRGTAENIVAGAVVNITSESSDVVWYKGKTDYTGYNRGVKSYTLTSDDVTYLASNSYIIYVATWDSKEISNITITAPGGGGESGGESGGGSSTKTLAEKIAAKEQLTDVPTLYFTIPDALNEDGTAKDINTVLFKDRQTNTALYHTATIQVVDKTEGGLTEFTDNVQIKVRGNSTADSDKKPYRLKFKDIKDEAGNVVATSQKHDLLGKGYAKRNWALLANYIDPAMVRNALTYKIGELVDMPFKPGYKFADVVINGEYRGTYQITDHVEVGTNRIDIDEDTGWFVESARGDMVEQPSASAASLIMSIKNPEPATDEDAATLKSQIESWFQPVDALFCIYDDNDAFDLAAFTNPTTGWRKYWDEESLVNFYLGINITGDYDGFMTVKMYRDLNKKLKFGPLWDKDLAFGNYDDGKKLAEDQQTGSYFASYVKKLWLDPVFVKKVHDKMATLIANGLVTTLENYIDALVTETSQTEALNQTKWAGYTSWASSYNSHEEAVTQLKEYLAPHITWLKETIDAQYEALGGDEIVDNSIPGDSYSDGTTPGGGGSGGDPATETGPAIDTEYVVENIPFNGNYNDYQISSSAFNSTATSALVTVKNAYYINFKLETTAWSQDAVSLQIYPNNGNQPQTGTYTLTGDELAKAKAGQLYVNCDGNENIVITVTNYREGGNTDPDPTTPTLPTIRLTASTINYEWQQASMTVSDPENIFNLGTEWSRTGVSKKGNALVSVQYQGSGGNDSKNSYRIKLNDKTQLLPSGSFKQWVLLANDDDPSMISNALAKELGDAVGMPWTPGYQFVELYVNDVFMGTYQLTDRIKAEEGRSLVTGGNKDADWQVRFNDAAELAEDGTSDYVASSDAMPNIVIKNPDSADLTAEAFATLKTDMQTYFSNVFAYSDNAYPNFAANVDKQQLINWYICQEVLSVYKGFSSIEAYRSITATAADNLLHFGPLWDSEKAFGNTGEAPAINMSDLNTNGEHAGLMTYYAAYTEMKQLFNYLWTQKWFASGVINKWSTLYGDNTTSGLRLTLEAKAAEIAATLAEVQPRNKEKWTASLGSYSTYADAVAAISTYLDERMPYLNKKFTELATAAGASICTEHVFTTKYTDNNDGTHSKVCDVCEAVSTEKVSHTYDKYAKQDDGTYRQSCVCDAVNASSDVYYEFTVYPESSAKTKVFATSWQPSEDKPNSIATVKITPSGAEANINGYNIINQTKNSEGDKTCADFRLTDGHPYYSEDGFAATKATYTRSITNAWGTLCLPYKIQEASTDYASFYHLSNVTNGETSTMFFTSVNPDEEDNCSAYMPVTFKATAKALSEGKIVVEGTNIKVKKSSTAKEKTTVENWKMIGTIESQRIKEKTVAYPDGTIYYISNNAFSYVPLSSGYTSNPFRAYFVYNPPASEAKQVKFSISEDISTGINTANINDALKVFIEHRGITLLSSSDRLVSIYTINGIQQTTVSLCANTSQHIALPAGLYIINGSKVIIK